ncbi:MAG: hypothetical protein ACP5VQ_06925 [Phycisphaerae bacterium]
MAGRYGRKNKAEPPNRLLEQKLPGGRRNMGRPPENNGKITPAIGTIFPVILQWALPVA